MNTFLYAVFLAVLAIFVSNILDQLLGLAGVSLAMAALTADRVTEKKVPGMVSYPVAAVKIYAGSLVAINAAGFLAPAADTASFKVVGIALENVDNSAGAAGALRCRVEAPIVARLNATSITQAMVGTKMFVVDDQTFDDATGTNSIVAGVLVEFISATEGRIYIDPTQQVL